MKYGFVPAGVRHECLFDVELAYVVASLVVVQQAVEADRRAREYKFADLDIGLYGARGAQSYQRQTAERLACLTRLEVDVGQCVQLRDADVDVADADAGRQHGHALALVGSGNGVKFSVGNFALCRIEKARNHLDASGVAHEYYRVGQLLGTQVEMENRSVLIDNQFGRWNYSHIWIILLFLIRLLA